jgi:hypothetical protein
MDCRHPDHKEVPDGIHATWVPAIHAGTTESRLAPMADAPQDARLCGEIWFGGREDFRIFVK